MTEQSTPQSLIPASTEIDIQSLQLACDRLTQQGRFLAGFLGTASHELRAPISQILSLHQLILEDLCESPTEEREFIAQANQAMIKVLHNLDLLIRLSKLEIGALQPQFKPLEIGLLLTEVQQLTTMKCTNRYCQLTLIGADSDVLVYGDWSWLQQVLILLIEGALAAGSEALQLTLESFKDKDNPVQIQVQCDRPLANWQVPPPSEKTYPADFSASFYYQIVARMAVPLGLNLELRGLEAGQGTVVALQFPG
ncbi:MAG: sensor histidine kinase [Nodosilinea sp.]